MPVLKARIGGAWQEVGLVQADEVWIGPTAPTDPSVELWYDSDAPDNPLNASNVAFTPGGFVAATNVQSAIAEVSDEAPKGIIAWKGGTHSTASVPVGPGGLTIYSVAATLTAGRAYECRWNVRAMSAAAGTNYMNFKMTCAPALTGFGGTDDYAYCPAAYGNIEKSVLLNPSVTQVYTIGVVAAVPSGTGLIWTEVGCYFRIIDIGKAVASS